MAMLRNLAERAGRKILTEHSRGLAFPSYAATGLLEGSEIAPTSGSNSKLYTKTAAWLGSDLLLNTRILEIRRPPSSCSCSPSS